MSKPPPAHHRTVYIQSREVANGYGGVRKIRGHAGSWIIVAAADSDIDINKGPWPTMVYVIVAPAQGPK